MPKRAANTVPDGAHADQVPTEPSAHPVFGGRYAIDAELGHGIVGSVFRARDLKLRREVAVKVLTQGAAGDAQLRARFEQEALVAGELHHPNVHAVYDVGEHAGDPYIVSELLSGETLRAVIARGPLAPDRVLHLAIQLASGLAAAHRLGIVHCDLTPDNIFLTEDGHLKILGLGIATGAAMGTPAYMSPEQLRGERVDARTDVFAFGSVLQEMLTGSPPFAKATTAETGHAILFQPPRPLPDSIGPELRAIVGRCLEKKPEARFEDANALLRELGGAPVRFGGWPRVRRRFGRPMAIALGLGAMVLAGREILSRRAAAFRVQALAVLPLENRSGDPRQDYLADGLTEAVIDELGAIGSLRVISRSSAMAYKGGKKALPQIASELGVDAVVEGSVSRLGDRLRLAARLVHAAGEKTLWSKTYEVPVIDVPGLQVDLANALVQGMNLVLTPGESERLAQRQRIDPAAYDLVLRAGYEGSELTGCDNYARIRGLLERAVAIAPDYAEAHARLSGSWAMGATMTCIDPKVAAPRARAEARRAIELDESNAEAHFALASVLGTFDFDFAGGERELRRAVELSPGQLAASGNWIGFLAISGRNDEAVAAARRGVLLDPASPVAWGMGLGWALYFASRYDESIAAERRALELDPRIVYGHMEIAWSLYEQGKVSESLREMEEARKVLQPGKSCFDDTMIAAGLAWGGKRQEAIALIEPWEKKAATEYVDGYQLAIPRVHLGDKDQAIRWLEMAWRQRSPSFMTSRVYPIDLEKRAWLGPLKGDPRVAELFRRPPPPP